ncbi:Ribonucleases P/MRP protein subunit pop1 [Coemansia sp. RSA 1939]|nr:Ribonucleases P/MRP protein subunit pop1 [Coemansia sp. RSA 1939]KAJ2594311.1 Ribonucleases P/MRP protein subunit pop1 [Coemansia sp. RSA 1804]KAJ2682194.1 Ribonucleases P/MRP protein subunit pop1 [Coemansia sp. RSA 1285]
MDAGKPRPKRKTQQSRGQGQEQGRAPKRMHIQRNEATLERARAIDVVGLVEARSFEINALQRAIDSARAAGNSRAFQTLPRHLRRRAASHNAKRVPVRLRERATAEIRKSAQTSGGQPAAAKRSNRYRRRRSRTVRGEYERRQAGRRWLETHVWHAKRMHMVERWGTMIAESPTERSHRAAYRAAREKTFVQDVSFFRTLEITGAVDAVVALLRRHAAPGCPVAPGRRAASLTLHRAGCFPLGCLGPATALWRPTASDNTKIRTVWLRLHPAHADAVAEEFATDCEGVQVTDISTDLVSFELLGAQSTRVLAAVLGDSSDSASCGAETLRCIAGINSPAALGEGCVLALRINDPRLRFPRGLLHSPAPVCADTAQLDAILQRWPDTADDLGCDDAGVWDRAQCAKDVDSRPSDKDLNERRRQNLVPGEGLQYRPGVDVTVPVIAVRSGPEALVGARVSGGGSSSDGLAHGWTLLAPRGWGMALWMALVFAGARAQGLRERVHAAFEAGLPSFPAHWPGTAAYDLWAAPIAADALLRWQRRPPGKRVNYQALGVQSPFFPPFHTLLGAAAPPTVYPRTGPAGFECSMRRLRRIHASAASRSESAPAAEPNVPAPDIWLLTGERMAGIVRAMLQAASAGDIEGDDDNAFERWARPLLDFVSPVTDALSLLSSCLVRVRLVCSGRGVPEDNAPVLNPCAGDAAVIIGYVMTGSFSLARGCGLGIGACSLRGLFALWRASQPASALRKCPRVLVASLGGASSADAVLSILC